MSSALIKCPVEAGNVGFYVHPSSHIPADYAIKVTFREVALFFSENRCIGCLGPGQYHEATHRDELSFLSATYVADSDRYAVRVLFVKELSWHFTGRVESWVQELSWRVRADYAIRLGLDGEDLMGSCKKLADYLAPPVWAEIIREPNQASEIISKKLFSEEPRHNLAAKAWKDTIYFLLDANRQGELESGAVETPFEHALVPPLAAAGIRIDALSQLTVDVQKEGDVFSNTLGDTQEQALRNKLKQDEIARKKAQGINLGTSAGQTYDKAMNKAMGAFVDTEALLFRQKRQLEKEREAAEPGPKFDKMKLYRAEWWIRFDENDDPVGPYEYDDIPVEIVTECQDTGMHIDEVHVAIDAPEQWYPIYRINQLYLLVREEAENCGLEIYTQEQEYEGNYQYTSDGKGVFTGTLDQIVALCQMPGGTHMVRREGSSAWAPPHQLDEVERELNRT